MNLVKKILNLLLNLLTEHDTLSLYQIFTESLDKTAVDTEIKEQMQSKFLKKCEMQDKKLIEIREWIELLINELK